MLRGIDRRAAPVPEWLRGLWRRRSIARPGGALDTTTTVYWLQTESFFADIRVPADRPDVRARGDLRGLAPDERRGLARQAGFAGWTELRGDRCRWHRSIDYQPPGGVPDEGRLIRGNGVLVEEGIHESYIEIWEPVPCGPGPIAVWDDPQALGVDLAVVCGDAFLAVRDRRLALPPAASLEEVVAGAVDAARAAAWLDCEIAYGVQRGGRQPWEIRLCTVPFREGESLAAGVQRRGLAGLARPA
ncbi:MAG: hypothetical protein SF182_02340 [Deltaproteobacteria bacterium]|nr:hypothetical protein [Deltaproteobacteria bacterium]